VVLVKRVGVTVDETAERLGYAETSSFIAAFKRWKGVSPGSYKRTSGEQAVGKD